MIDSENTLIHKFIILIREVKLSLFPAESNESIISNGYHISNSEMIPTLFRGGDWCRAVLQTQVLSRRKLHRQE